MGVVVFESTLLYCVKSSHCFVQFLSFFETSSSSTLSFCKLIIAVIIGVSSYNVEEKLLVL